MMKAIYKTMLLILIMITPLLSLAQHHLYFHIPECPNTVNIESEEIFDFNISPVPAKDFLNISFDNSVQLNNTSTVEVFDINGKIINITYLESLKKELIFDVSSFKKGIYFIRYKDQYTIITKKFIITK